MINYSQLSATCLVGYLPSHVQRPHVVEYSYLLCTVGHFEFALESGLVLFRMAPWDCCGDAVSSFTEYHEVVQDTGLKFVP